VIPLPDGRLLITDKTGYMQIRDAAGALIKKITGFPEVDAGGQGGMLDVALDPGFTSNKTIYWSFSENYGKGNLMAVAKGQLNEADSKIETRCDIPGHPALRKPPVPGYLIKMEPFCGTGERSILRQGAGSIARDWERS
jgi:glucose/arabinose dehydrogenase